MQSAQNVHKNTCRHIVDIYAKYTEARVNEEFEALKDALCMCSCPLARRTKNGEDNEYTVNVNDWFEQYTKANPQTKCTSKSFRSNVAKYLEYANGSIGGKAFTKMYFVTNAELIAAIENHQKAAVADIPTDDDDDEIDDIEAQIAALQAKLDAKKSAK